MTRLSNRFSVLWCALLLLLVATLGAPGGARAQSGSEDLGSSPELQHQKLVEDYEARIRALYAQNAFRETTEFCDRLLAIDADNRVATLYKERAEAAISGSAPVQRPVRSLPRTPSAMPTPVPLVQSSGIGGGRSIMDSLSDESNRTLVILLLVLLALLIVVAIVGFVMLRRSRLQYQKALSSAANPMMGGTSMGGLHDMVTSVGGGGEASSPIADMPTMPEEYTAPKAAPRQQDEAPAQEPSFVAVGGLQSAENIALDFGPAPVPKSNEMEIGEFSGMDMDPSDSQMSDVEVTQGDTFSAPPAKPFAPAQPPVAPKASSRKSSELELPPISPNEAVVGADDPFAETAHVESVSAADDPFAVAAPLPPSAGAAEADPFAAPPPGAGASTPDEMTFNSLMFGGAPQASGQSNEQTSVNDDLTLGSFNDQFSDVMLGPGTDQTSGVENDIHDQQTMLGVPGFGNPDEGTIGLEGFDAPPPKSSDEATVNITPKKEARPAAGAPVGGSMFDRQLAAGKAAFDEGDFAKAVQCLSVAASLRPNDKDLREMLEAARAKRK